MTTEEGTSAWLVRHAGLLWGVALVGPGLGVSMVLERHGAAAWLRFVCQFVTTMVCLWILASYQRKRRPSRSTADRR